MAHMNNPSNIERIVMRRVHTIRILRLIISGGFLAMFVFALALWGIGREVWVARVFQNAPENIIDAARFYLYAFDQTRFIVQSLSVITIASLVYLARETARTLSSLFIPARN